MVMNFHFGRGLFFEWEFLIEGTGLPVLGGLLALLLGGSGLPLSINRQ